MEYFTWFLFFALGFTFAKAFSFLTNFGYSLQLLKGSETITLRLAMDAVKDVEFIQDLKYQNMKDLGLDDGQIEIIKVIDNKILKSWKQIVIKKIVNSYPDSYKSNLLYNDWAGAEKYMEKVST